MRHPHVKNQFAMGIRPHCTSIGHVALWLLRVQFFLHSLLMTQRLVLKNSRR